MYLIKGITVSAVAMAVPAWMLIGVEGPTEALFSQYLGLAALVAMALSQLIATRAWFVEPIFGALDRAYILHKWLGICALAAILLHDSIDAEIKSLGRGTALTDLADGMGEQSYNGLLILIAITLITFIPYRLWYWTHRAMGVCFVLGAFHFAFILKPFSNVDPVGIYVLAFCAIGTAAYVYTLLPRSWRRGRMYTVVSVQKTGSALAITMVPESRVIRHRAGQFAFFSLESQGRVETHPFTISSAPQPNGTLRISVAALGDYTKWLSENLQKGMRFRVHGPYGRFVLRRRKSPQVWIAGGIGITPFLSWLDTIAPDGSPIDLIYTFRGHASAAHLSELKQKALEKPRVNLHLFDTQTGPRIDKGTLARITKGKKSHVAFCGPLKLRQSICETSLSRPVQFEEFEIRTGLPYMGFVAQIG
ncbi:ferredoxin reductase family protein [Parasedimentitalea denitrificans]|nr:ferric reductase-like transmembrane domain-containing protein [Sedimentitalea sp. CY04]